MMLDGAEECQLSGPIGELVPFTSAVWVTGWGRICNCQSSRLESIEDEPDDHRASPIAVATRSIEWLLTSRRG
jgi:hypothetical protein